jgi:hypothetical protein
MDIDYHGGEFSPDNEVPNYWELFTKYNLGDVKNNMPAVFSNDKNGIEFKKWIQSRAEGLLKCYIMGLTTGVKLASRMCIDDFTMYIYVIEKTKVKEKPSTHMKPEPMKPTKTELDRLYNEDKIQDEIDDMLNNL